MKISIRLIITGILITALSALSFGQSADFTVNTNEGCTPLSVICTYTGGDATTWSWTLNTPTAQSAAIPNPTFTITVPGTYTLNLSVNGGASQSQQIIVNDLPSPDFVADITQACAPQEVCFTYIPNPGDAPIVDYSWNLGVPQIQTAQNPCVTYTQNSNQFAIQLAVTDANGCLGVVEKPNYIRIDKAPVPNFNVTVPTSCVVPFTPEITNLTTNSSEFQYNWTFPGGTPGTANTHDPGDIVYNSDGNYDITLVTSDNGCTDQITITDAIQIAELVADFDIDDDTPCQLQSVQFTDQSSLPGLNYNWLKNGVPVGSNSPVYNTSFTTVGIHNVTLIVATQDNLCRDTITKTVDVRPGPETDFTASSTNSCGIPFVVNFTSDSPDAISYSWLVEPGGLISNAANPTFTFTSLGSYDVTLVTTSANGCSRTVVKNDYIQVSEDLNVSIVPTVNGEEISPPNYPQGCVPLDVQFTIEANLPSGVSISSVSWDLPGGTPVGNGQTVNTTYNAVGDYIASATVSFTGGCNQASTSTTVEVGNKPTLTADITPASVCLNDVVTATATSDLPGTQFTWYFEPPSGIVNGQTGTSTTNTYTYEDQWANFDVELVGENNGCRDTVITTVEVLTPGATILNWTRSCDNKSEVTFQIDESQADFADEFIWEIVSGPGAGTVIGSFTSISQTEFFTYDFGSIDEYEISLTVSSSFTGCSDELIYPLDLSNAESNASISPSSLCPGETVTFFENSPEFASWQWVFGNGDTSNVVTTPTQLTAQFDETGTFDAILFTVNQDGCLDTFYHKIYVGGGVADIGGTLGACSPPLNTSFNTGPSSFSQGGVASADWLINIGDGGPLVPFNDELNPGPFSYTDEGDYLVYLVAYDSIGCSDDTTIIVRVGDVEASFTSNVTRICAGQDISFTNLTLGGNLSYDWTFTGGVPAQTYTSTDKNPTITFQSTGFYDVTLIATDTIGNCSDDTTIVAYVDASGSGYDIVATNTSTNCPPLITEFSLTPPTPIGSIENIVWYVEASDNNGLGPVNLGNDSIQNLTTDVPWIYTGGGPDGNGFYDVHAYVTTSQGCVEPVIKDNFIFVGGPTGDFSFDPKEVCIPGTVLFTEENIDRTDSIVWDYGDGNTLETAAGVGSVSTTYDFPGVYYPKVILEKDGCVVVREPDDPIRVSNVEASAALDELFVCDEGMVQFTSSTVIDSAAITGDFIAQTVWDFGDGSPVSNEENPLHNYTGNVTGDLTIDFSVVTDIGCMDDTSFTFSIYETPNGTVGPDPTICLTGNTQLSAVGAANYQWSPTNTILGSSTVSNPTVQPSDTTEYMVLMYNQIECPDTQYVNVNVIERLEGNAGTSTQICAGGSAQLISEATVFPPNANLTYSWFPPTGLDNSNIANPVASPTTSVTYTVTIASPGCPSFTQNVTILVDGASFVNAGEDQIIVSGASADLSAFSPGNFSFNWFDAEGNFIDNTQTINTGPLTESTTFTVEVGDNACRSSDEVAVIILETCDDGQVSIPNVFTPNGDGVNDIFKIETGLGISSVSGLRIFNRWGEIVFESEGVTDGWDGTQNGSELKPGVYVYSVEVTCSDNSTSIRKGNITLLK